MSALHWIFRQLVVIVAALLAVGPAIVGVICVAFVSLVLFAALGAMGLLNKFFNKE